LLYLKAYYSLHHSSNQLLARIATMAVQRKKRSSSAEIEPDLVESSPKRSRTSESSTDAAAGLLLFLSKQPFAKDQSQAVQIGKSSRQIFKGTRYTKGMLPPPSFHPIHVSEDEEDNEGFARKKLMPIDLKFLNHNDYTADSKQRLRVCNQSYIGKPLASAPRLPDVAAGDLIHPQR
jgi:hypothetical protein